MKHDIHEIQWFDCKIESSVTESAAGRKKTQYIISGPFMKADVPTRNDRVYPREEANKAIAALRPMVAEKRIRMLVDHPEFFSGPALTRSGALLLDITDIQEDGFAYYKAKILNTSVGKELKAILDEGSKVGVSTRGCGNVNSQEIPGYEGKYSVISDYEIQSIDFVDDPAVLDTEVYMQLESKKRSSGMFKTVDEMKATCPDLVQNIVDSTTAMVKQEYETKVAEAAQLSMENVSILLALAEQVKKLHPEMFTIVEESAIVAEKDKEIATVTKKMEEASAEIEALKKQIKEAANTFIKNERDAFIEQLHTTDPDFFLFESFKDCFENCLTKDEVKTVYEANSKIIAELKEKVAVPAPAKTVQTEETSEPEVSGLTEEQANDLHARNLQRRRNGLEPWSEEVYLEKFGK